MDHEFLDSVMGEIEGVGKVDEFVGTMWRGWRQLRDEGLVQVISIFLYLIKIHTDPGTLVAPSTWSIPLGLPHPCAFS
jgi:hypothetical protein